MPSGLYEELESESKIWEFRLNKGFKVEIPDNNKLAGLEALRFIAALAVVVWHYQHFSFSNGSSHLLFERQPFFSSLYYFYKYGYAGVKVFWCISGFIFFWKYGDTISNKAISSKDFAILRFSRLWPLHFATLIMVAVLQYLYWSPARHFFVYQTNDLENFLMQVPMASAWFGQNSSFNGPIWSVSVEILVYIFFYALCRLIGSGYVATIGVLILAEQFRFWPILTYRFQSLKMATVYFFAGGLTALVAASVNSQIQQLRRSINYMVLAAYVVLAATIFVLPATHRLGFEDSGITIVAATLCVYVLHLVDFRGLRANSVFAAIGSLTYSSYLLHFPLQLLIVLLCLRAGWDVPLYAPWFFLLYVALVFVLAFFCYRLFELPMQNGIRRKFGVQARRGEATQQAGRLCVISFERPPPTEPSS